MLTREPDWLANVAPELGALFRLKMRPAIRLASLRGRDPLRLVVFVSVIVIWSVVVFRSMVPVPFTEPLKVRLYIVSACIAGAEKRRSAQADAARVAPRDDPEKSFMR